MFIKKHLLVENETKSFRWDNKTQKKLKEQTTDRNRRRTARNNQKASIKRWLYHQRIETSSILPYWEWNCPFFVKKERFPFTPGCFELRLIELTSIWFWIKQHLKTLNILTLCCNKLPLEREWFSFEHIFDPLTSNLWQVWLKLIQRFWISRQWFFPMHM